MAIEERHHLNENAAERPSFGTVDDKSVDYVGTEDTEEETNNDSSRWKIPFLIEPAVFLYFFSTASFSQLSVEYPFYRYRQQVHDELMDNDFIHRSIELKNLSGREIANNYTSDLRDLVAIRQTADFVTWSALTRGFPCLIVTILVFCYSEIKGKKYGLTLPCIGGSFKSLLFLLIELNDTNVSYGTIGFLIEGFFGYQAMFIGTAFMYLTDVAPYSSIMRRIALLQCCQFFATSVAGVGTGLMLTRLGFAACFVILFSTFLSCLLYIRCLLPEAEASRLESAPSFSQLFVSFGKQIKPLFFSNFKMLFVFLVLGFVYLAHIEVQILYHLGPMTGRGPMKIGFFVATFSLTGNLCTLGTGLLLHFCPSSGMVLVMMCSLFGGIGLTLQTVISNNLIHICAVFIGVMAAYSSVVRCSISKQSKSSEQEAAQNVISMTAAIAELVSPCVLCGIYRTTADVFQPAVLIFMAATAFVVFIAAIIAFTFSALIEPVSQEVEEEEETPRSPQLFIESPLPSSGPDIELEVFHNYGVYRKYLEPADEEN